jgi:hypothetical protein
VVGLICSYTTAVIFFVEVKSRNDRLSEDQKNWLLGNHKYIKFKVILFKVGNKIA